MENEDVKTDSQKRVVLIVDDEPLLRSILVDLMEEGGYAVIEASSAAVAWPILTEGVKVDILVADFSMPGMNGVDLIKAAQQARPGLPAILLTGYGGNAEAFHAPGSLLGKFEVLPKPIDEPLLMLTMQALLASR